MTFAINEMCIDEGDAMSKDEIARLAQPLRMA